jgi:hypothetical protein
MFGFGSLRTLGPDTAHSALSFARAACRLPKSASIGRLQGLEDSLKVSLPVNLSKSPSLAQAIDTSGGLHGWTTLQFSGDGYSKDTAAACGSREVVAAQVDPPSFAQPVPLSDFLDFAFNKSFNNLEESKPNDESWQLPDAPPNAYFANDARSWRAILRRSTRSGVIRLGEGPGSDARPSAGAFCTDKKLGRLQRICD